MIIVMNIWSIKSHFTIGLLRIQNKLWMFCLFLRSKTQDGSQDVLNVMIFLEDFIYYSGLSRKVSRASVDTNINIRINKES